MERQLANREVEQLILVQLAASTLPVRTLARQPIARGLAVLRAIRIVAPHLLLVVIQAEDFEALRVAHCAREWRFSAEALEHVVNTGTALSRGSGLRHCTAALPTLIQHRALHKQSGCGAQ